MRTLVSLMHVLLFAGPTPRLAACSPNLALPRLTPDINKLEGHRADGSARVLIVSDVPLSLRVAVAARFTRSRTNSVSTRPALASVSGVSPNASLLSDAASRASIVVRAQRLGSTWR